MAVRIVERAPVQRGQTTYYEMYVGYGQWARLAVGDVVDIGGTKYRVDFRPPVGAMLSCLTPGRGSRGSSRRKRKQRDGDDPQSRQ